MTAVTWADIRAGDVVRLKGDDWLVAQTDQHAGPASPVEVVIQRQGRTVGPRTMDAGLPVERVDPPVSIGETVRAESGDLPAAEALAAVQLGAVVIGRKDGTAPWQVVGVDETMIHAHLYNFHGIDVVAVGSAAEAMALHFEDHATVLKLGSFVEHEHVS